MPNDSPSRVAYFIGFKIVSEFMERTDRIEIPVEDMMKLSDSRKFLKLSKLLEFPPKIINFAKFS